MDPKIGQDSHQVLPDRVVVTGGAAEERSLKSWTQLHEMLILFIREQVGERVSPRDDELDPGDGLFIK